MDDLARAAAVLRDAGSLLVLTGAGISAESGVPTYRGPGGRYEEDPSIESIVTAETLRDDPLAVWAYVDEVRGFVARAEPNDAHLVLADWERRGRFGRFLIATQNVDGLHQAAGSDAVSEIHGSVWELAVPRPRDYAEDAEFSGDMSDLLLGRDREALLRKWSRENGRVVWEDRDVPFPRRPPSDEPGLRPNALLFGEDYGDRLIWIEDFIGRGCDAVLVVGCSGGVWILDALIRQARAANPACAVVNVNPHADCVEGEHLHLPEAAAHALRALDDLLL